MNFIQNFFRGSIKPHNNITNNNKPTRWFSPEKCPTNARSQSYSDDKNWRQISVQSSFYLQKMMQVKLGNTDIVPWSRQEKSHMVYQICVLTSDFEYTLKKRFSLFNQFYCQVKKQISNLNIVFPKKTLLVSGTNIDVVTQRYQLLNNFIQRIFSEVKSEENKQLAIKFLNFLDIQEEFERRKIKTLSELPQNPSDKNQSFCCVQDTSISFQLRKLNDYNNHQIDILSRLENYITYKNYKLNNDEIKTLLTGNTAINLKGLLNLSLSINNEIKALELLKFLVSYLSPQKKSYHDKIYKQFEKLPLQAFHFNYDHVKNNFTIIEFKKMFFIILELYCHNKFFDQTKILQKYPELLPQFELWKNLSQINHGNISKKSASATHHQFQHLIRKTLSHPEKSKSFEIKPKACETRPQSLSPLISAENVENLGTNSIYDEKYKKYSFRSNDSTSELTIEEDWENSKMKVELGQNYDSIIESCQENMQTLQSSNLYCLKSNKCNKISIEILQTLKSLSECQQASASWNKLIYDERHDQFTGISRIYVKLNGKSKIFKYKQEDEKIEKKDENSFCISKKRLESFNSIAKSGKENLQENLIFKVSSHSNGFQEIITVENIEKDLGNQQKKSYRKVMIQFNFEGEEDYFKTEINGYTTYLLRSALEAYSQY